MGTRLHLAEHQLNTIQANHVHSPTHSQDCLNSMFVFWLNNCDQPTCEFLIQAVDAMGRRDVVTKLCEKYGEQHLEKERNELMEGSILWYRYTTGSTLLVLCAGMHICSLLMFFFNANQLH